MAPASFREVSPRSPETMHDANSKSRYHPFWKLISQMIFGVHLLAKELARSETSVTKILQDHVDELDGFLERTTEDLMIMRLDVHTRIQYLTLPFENLEIFDEMLADRAFRLSIVAYNDQIEHSIDRFTQTITDSLKDLQKAKEAMSALWIFFKDLSNEGYFASERLEAFSHAMMENMEGWMVAISKLRRQGTALLKTLSQLGLATTEMQRRVGVASRKDVVSRSSEAVSNRFSAYPVQRSFIHQSTQAAKRNKPVKQRLFEKRVSTIPEKPLPRDPLSRSRRTPTKSKHLHRRAPVQDQAKPPRDPTSPGDGVRRILNRAKSCSALFAEAGADTGERTLLPSPGKLKRGLSKPFLPKRATSEKLDLHDRPRTAPQPPRPSRSISIEQLRAFCTTPHRLSVVKTPTSSTQARQDAQDQLESRETLKTQISQFLKTDRVLEAWEISKNATCCPCPIRTKELPSSVFRTKSSVTLPEHTLSGPVLDRPMSWAQGTFNVLPVHSFKTKPDLSPRIHVLSVQMALDECVTEREASLDMRSEGSITALPDVSIPPLLAPPVCWKMTINHDIWLRLNRLHSNTDLHWSTARTVNLRLTTCII